MRVLGLTGSVAMGKSTAAGVLRRAAIPVHDADATVHRLMARGGVAVPEIDAAFPGVVADGRVDRRALGDRVFGDPALLARLENILHPLVRREARRFIARQAAARRLVVVLDSPLLFETGGDRFCDAVMVVSAPARVQAARVLARPGMTRAKLRGILERQMPDREKRRRADVVIETGLGKRHALRAILRAVTLSRDIPSRVPHPPKRAIPPAGKPRRRCKTDA